HGRGAQPLADLAFVLVHLRSVDVTIAEPQRLLHDPRADASAQIPGAQPDRRNSCAIGFDKVHRRLSADPAPIMCRRDSTANRAFSRGLNPGMHSGSRKDASTMTLKP